VFDRYGKLLKNIRPLEAGWDGTFNGYNLPNDDYWYMVILPDGKEYRGHFALVR
jgi:gliding motility-associated-like protein